MRCRRREARRWDLLRELLPTDTDFRLAADLVQKKAKSARTAAWYLTTYSSLF